MTPAKIMLDQLGGKRFIAMTGASRFVGGQTTLMFKLPGNPGFVKDGINCVRITLTPADLYDVEFVRMRGIDFKVKHKAEGIGCEQLREVFERHTGLRTSL